MSSSEEATHEHAAHQPRGAPPQPAFSQAVVVEQPTKWFYIGGQNGVDADGKVVGPTVGEQASQRSATSPPSSRAKGKPGQHRALDHRRVGGHAFDEGFAAFQAWNPADPPPAITVHVVAGLAPRLLVEIDAAAAV